MSNQFGSTGTSVVVNELIQRAWRANQYDDDFSRGRLAGYIQAIALLHKVSYKVARQIVLDSNDQSGEQKDSTGG